MHASARIIWLGGTLLGVVEERQALTRVLPTPPGSPRLTSGLPWGHDRNGVVSDRRVHPPHGRRAPCPGACAWPACFSNMRAHKTFAPQRADGTPHREPYGACGMALAHTEEEDREAALPWRTLPRAVQRGYPQARKDDPMTITRVMRMMTGLMLLVMVATGCGTLTGAAIGAGSGAAIGAGTGNTARGALIGAGVGAAAGAIYDAAHPYPYYTYPYSRGQYRSDYRRW
jgi:hypothetical protein